MPAACARKAVNPAARRGDLAAELGIRRGAPAPLQPQSPVADSEHLMSVRRIVVYSGLTFSLASLAFSLGGWSAQRHIERRVRGGSGLIVEIGTQGGVNLDASSPGRKRRKRRHEGSWKMHGAQEVSGAINCYTIHVITI